MNPLKPEESLQVSSEVFLRTAEAGQRVSTEQTEDFNILGKWVKTFGAPCWV